MDINEKEKSQLKDGIEEKSTEEQSELSATPQDVSSDEPVVNSDENREEEISEETISPSVVEEQNGEEDKEDVEVVAAETTSSDSPEEVEATAFGGNDDTVEKVVEETTDAIESVTEAQQDTKATKDEQPAPEKPIETPAAEQPSVTADLNSEPTSQEDKEESTPEETTTEVASKAVETAEVPVEIPQDEAKSEGGDEVKPEEPARVSEPEETTAAEQKESESTDTDKEEEPAKEEDKEEVTAESEAGADEKTEEEESHLDYSNYTKKQMVQVLESLLKEDDFSQVGRILKEIKKPYDILVSKERKEAYDRYIEDGGEKDGFEYRFDDLSRRFEEAYGKLRERRNQYFNSLEKQKEQNLQTKLNILEKLRQIVDSEETGSSIKTLKELQNQWKEVGVIPSSQNKSLWANYNALLDRFYDQRSIYFELKELDRKKNYDLKIELCEKAEQLSQNDNIREVIHQLNELHDEFKHIGPVPKDDQDTVWERFKAASDKIYSRRKDYYEKLKSELKVNEVAKEALVEKVIPFADFASDRISEWNSKTKEIIAIQKEWEAIGSLPKEKAKAINKQFWTSFKSFFNKKGQFFKKIEEERKDNLLLKKELVEKAEALKDSEDFRKTSDELKRLQKKWKEIGPVPEKHRNEVFLQFKGACDYFFNRRRANSGKIEKEYEENLKKKQVLCQELEDMAKLEKIDVDRIKKIEAEWSEIGFVPKNDIRTIQKRYTDAISEVTDKTDLPEAEKHKLRFSAQFHNINYGPGSEKMIQKKEGALRRQITNLENDINLWKNNIDFFASSKNADKLKKDFQVKIDKANAQLKSLKEQLKVISNI